MLSKREEEKNEKILRGLMKLPPNRNCINCNSLGPQYVCTDFWTFVCMTCSGIHREFTHRVKSVSMAKFTKQEIEALQKGGNQRAREMFLKDWDMQQMRLSSNSNADKIRGFIKDVFVHKKYAGGTSSDNPPRDTQNLKEHEEDHRRANSYHSFSQSPPYEHQYEDRRYGKRQTITLTRRPSDQGLYRGTVSSSVCSPTREHIHAERSPNGSSGSRFPDYPLSSSQSPNFQDSGHNSPNLHQLQDTLVEDAPSQPSKSTFKRGFDAIPHPQRTVPGSFGSIDSNPKLSKPVRPGNTTGAVLEPESSNRTQKAAVYKSLSLSQSSTLGHARNQDLASLSPVQASVDLFANVNHQSSSAPSIDLFPNVNHQSSSAPSIDLFAVVNHQSSFAPLEQNPLPVHATTSSAPSIDLFANFSHQSSSTLLEQNPSLVHLSNSSAPSIDLFANFIQQSSSTLLEQKRSPLQPSTPSAPLVDFFANVSHQFSSTSLEQKPSAVMTSMNEGWANFYFPQPVGFASETNTVVYSVGPPGNEEANGSEDALTIMHGNSQWFSMGSSTVLQPFTSTTKQLNMSLKEDVPLLNQKIFQQWRAIDDFSGTMSPSEFVTLPPNSGLQFPVNMPSSSDDSKVGFKSQRSQQSSLDNTLPHLTLPSTGASISSNTPSVYPPMAEASRASKSTNPFALAYDSAEANDLFLDMSSVKAAMPDPQMPSTFLSGLPHQWFPHNSVTQGGIAYLPGQPQSPTLPNLPRQGSMVSFGGNPFA